MCSFLQQSCLPGKSANYNIKAVSTSDLFAFALYAITLNQERSVLDVGSMQNFFFSYSVACLYNWISEHKHVDYYPRDFASDLVFAYTDMALIITYYTYMWK